MGEIIDEYDDESEAFKQIKDNEYVLEGVTSLDDIERNTGIILESENNETLAGFIIDLIDEIPRAEDVGRKVYFDGIEFTLMEIDHNQIKKVKMTCPKDEVVVDKN